MNKVILILASVLIVSLISLIGIFFIFMKKKNLNKLILFLVAVSVGSLLGGAFLHLIPEIIDTSGFTLTVAFLILGGILFFFALENFIRWRHCHEQDCKVHKKHLGPMNLIGDGIHNLTDGLIISGAYFASIPLGIATTLAVIIHEIPQEIGDFGVLLYSGYTKKKALFFNFLSALVAMVGAIIGILFSESSQAFSSIVVPLAVGGFLYIAGSDLIPEIHAQQNNKFSIKNLAGMILGILIMYALTFLKMG